MTFSEIYNSTQLIDLIHQVGFLPLLDSGIPGFSAEEIVADDCRYVTFPEGGWDWPLWKWKGTVVKEGDCVYGKFFNRKAGFISREWWADFVNYRRNIHSYPEENSIEEVILSTLDLDGSQITRKLRKACGFDGPKMRGKFDTYVTRLQMATYIVTEDFLYPRDRHNNTYGWGWALLNTPERLYGRASLECNRTPQESYDLMLAKLRSILPEVSDSQITRIIK